MIRSQAHSKIRQFDEARDDIQKAERAINQTTFLDIEELYNYSKGLLAFQLKEHDEALKYLKEILIIPQEDLVDPLIKLESYKFVEEIYALSGEVENAYQAGSNYSKLRDELFSPEQLGFMIREVRNYNDILKVRDEEIAYSQSLLSQLGELNTRNLSLIHI